MDDLGRRTEEWRNNHPLRKRIQDGNVPTNKAAENLGITDERLLDILAGSRPTDAEMGRITKQTGSLFPSYLEMLKPLS